MRSRRRALGFLTGGVVCVLLAAGCSDSDPEGGAVPSSTPTSTSSLAASPSTLTGSRGLTFTEAIVDTPSPGPRPDRFLSTSGSVVVVRDFSSGRVLEELARFTDPAHVPTEGPRPNRAGDVALSADGRTAYYSVSPEPACGNVSEVPIAGGESESRGDGAYVAPGPLGYFVTSGGCSLSIRKGATVLRTMATPGESFLGPVAWSPDGRYIAVEWSVHDGDHLVMVLDLAAADPWGSATEIRSPGAFGPQYPAFRNDSRLVVVEQPEGEAATARVLDTTTGALVTTFSYGGKVVDQAYDATHTWLLVTMADGRLRWFGGGDQGDLGVDGQVSADW